MHSEDFRSKSHESDVKYNQKGKEWVKEGS